MLLTDIPITVQMYSMKPVRIFAPQIHGAGWTVHVAGHSLPLGLKPNTRVTIAQIDEEKRSVVVQDANGAEWSLPAINFDCGYEFEYFGHWVEEWRSGILNCLERELLSEIAEVQSGNLRRKSCKGWALRQMILLRNGRGFVSDAAQAVYERLNDRRVERLPVTVQMAVAC